MTRVAFYAHLWLGVIFTTALVVISVTGILLNHKRGLGLMPDVANEPERPFSESLPLARLADIALDTVWRATGGDGEGELLDPTVRVDRMDIRPHMTLGLAAMLLGVFVVPAMLLWAGHRLRRRPPRWRGAFWGAVIAHVVALPIAVVAAMMPAAEWAPTDTMRGALGFWLLLVAPLFGAAIGAMNAGRTTQS